MHHRDTLGDAQRHVEIVLDDHVADMLRQRVEDRDEVTSFGRRKPCRGFVEEDEARRPGERQRDFQLALLSVRKRRDQRVAVAVEMDGVEDRFRLRHVHVGLRRAEQGEAPPRDAAAGEEDRVDDAQATEQLRDLVGPAQPAPDALVGRQVRDVLAEEADASGRRQEVAGDSIEQRGLAGAVRPRTARRSPAAILMEMSVNATRAPKCRATPSSSSA